MTSWEFIAKWKASELKERSAAQEHFIDLCRLLGEPTPAEADPAGKYYCFERGTSKDSGGDGWADVWKRHHFAWEYKGRRANLDATFDQLRQYTLALENPPLLIVSDMARIRIRTNWTNSVSETYEYSLDDLADATVRDRLKWAMSDPDRLRPGISRQALTEKAASTFAKLAHALQAQGCLPQEVALFVNRLVFCMFAEDVGLLPNNMFKRMLEHAYKQPEEFAVLASELFGVMATGGRIGFEIVDWFNGGLFNNNAALPLGRAELETVLEAANLDWSEIDPSILGTLFERGLNPDKRAQLGAHYTDREKINMIIEPVVVRPWLSEWQIEKSKITATMEKTKRARSKAMRARQRGTAERLYRKFLERLRNFKVLDPACGSGNFLYLALHALKDLEHQVQIEAEALGLQREFPVIGPSNVKGIEINAFAAELARVSIWIGEIQWMRRNGFSESRDPILQPLDTIECRDAILAPDGKMPEWPEADVVIGNPPFLGYSPMREVLGNNYTDSLRTLYQSAVPAFADLVCYWFHITGKLLDENKLVRAGLVATNSIRGGRNRIVLERITRIGQIFEAWSDEPWVVEGAAVRVSLICFANKNSGLSARLDGREAPHIHPDLTADSVDLTLAQKIDTNKNTAFVGGFKKGKFDIAGNLASAWLTLPQNPNGKSNAEVLKPLANGIDLVRRPRGYWIVDFGHERSETEAALYEVPFQYVLEHVKPVRLQNNRQDLREHWWRHDRSGQTMFRRIGALPRYIATPRVAKHRLFIWCDSKVYPDSALIVIARSEDAIFGILHSRFHEAWSLRLCTWLGAGNDPRYTPTTTFETFPFPEGLTPDMSPAVFESDPRAVAIAAAAQHLVILRNRWLNPSEWIEWVKEPVAGYPQKPVARDDECARRLKSRTLTNLYNNKPQWLSDAHAQLDAAVAAAYGWSSDITEEKAFSNLLALNLSRSS